jgi:predicted permease
LLEEGRNIPGVSSAALSTAVPYNFELRYFHVYPAGRPIVQDGKPTSGRRAGYTAVSHNYFSTLGIPLLRGRDFTAAESSQRETRGTAIIDESLARALFPDEDALGRHIVLNPAEAVGHPDREIEIVGIVRSPQDDIFQANAPLRLYRPLGQMHESNAYLHLKVSTPQAQSTVLDHVRRELSDLDRSTPLLSVRPLTDFLHKNINLLLVQMAASAFSVFGLVAVVLAVVGVYGLKAYAVAQRTREIGIRLALGAQARDVLKLILRQGAAQVAVAAAAGIALALLAGQALSKMLYRVEPFDPVLLTLASLVTIGAALLACWIPARRATRVDPAVALRSE